MVTCSKNNLETKFTIFKMLKLQQKYSIFWINIYKMCYEMLVSVNFQYILLAFALLLDMYSEKFKVFGL